MARSGLKRRPSALTRRSTLAATRGTDDAWSLQTSRAGQTVLEARLAWRQCMRLSWQSRVCPARPLRKVGPLLAHLWARTDPRKWPGPGGALECAGPHGRRIPPAPQRLCAPRAASRLPSLGPARHRRWPAVPREATAAASCAATGKWPPQVASWTSLGPGVPLARGLQGTALSFSTPHAQPGLQCTLADRAQERAGCRLTAMSLPPTCPRRSCPSAVPLTAPGIAWPSATGRGAGQAPPSTQQQSWQQWHAV